MSASCSAASLAAREPLSATAPTVTSWLLLEVPGSWPRDVSGGGALDGARQEEVAGWLSRDAATRRLLYVRRPGPAAASALAFVVRADETETEMRRFELGARGRARRVDFEEGGELFDMPLVLVCGHGTRDRCCARLGTAVYRALRGRLGAEELWISSHQGGHRFAANVLVLPASLQFGRVAPDEAPGLVERALEGRIELTRYRGRTCYEPALQAAEHAVRSSAGLDQVAALRDATIQGSVACLRGADGTVHEAEVEEVEGPSVPPSCGVAPELQRRFVARVLGSGLSDGDGTRRR